MKNGLAYPFRYSGVSLKRCGTKICLGRQTGVPIFSKNFLQPPTCVMGKHWGWISSYSYNLAHGKADYLMTATFPDLFWEPPW